MVHHSCCTPLWRAVSKAWPTLRNNIACSVGDGATVDFFDDVWIPSLGPLRSHVLDNSQDLTGLSFSDFMDGNGNWDLNLLLSKFPHSIASHIIAIKCPDVTDIADKPYWRLSNSQSFSIRSAYESLACSTWDNIKSSCWKGFWSLPVPQRLRLFIWLSYKERLMTNVERCRRSFGQSLVCLCCHTHAETIVHVLRDCYLAHAVWSNLIPPNCNVDFFHSHFQVWLYSNLTVNHIHPTFDLKWSTLFASTLWKIWCMRNNWVFNGFPLSTDSILHKSVTWARYYTDSWMLKERVSPGNALPPHAHWERLDEGWVCLNTDGTVSSSTGYGSIGGIFRTHDGSWLLGFNKSVGVTQSFQSELWTIFYGLQIARDNGFVHLLIQTDCLEVVTRLNAPSAGSDVNALVRAIVRLQSAGETTIVR
ncbi:hypothetical protein V6N11_010950 [Hibiscus sabdariffa]|uniref:Uncharacterized protein n=1 Tax=Hibiscus sabdariffa TaxID=183260 RepID=A0ABR2S6Z7_9ROSI